MRLCAKVLWRCDTRLDPVPVLPQLLEGSHCAAMGYVSFCDVRWSVSYQALSLRVVFTLAAQWQTYQAMDNIYTPVRLFWKTVRRVSTSF